VSCSPSSASMRPRRTRHLQAVAAARSEAPSTRTSLGNSSFWRPRSEHLSMAERGLNKSTRRSRHHMPARSRQRRATQLSGRLPACSIRHHVPPSFKSRSINLVLREPPVLGTPPSIQEIKRFNRKKERKKDLNCLIKVCEFVLDG